MSRSTAPSEVLGAAWRRLGARAIRGGLCEGVVPRGEVAALLYRFGRGAASGVLVMETGPDARCAGREVLVLRRGHLMTTEADALGRHAGSRLAHLCAWAETRWSFDGATAAYPPGAAGRQVSLEAWSRRHLESQLDVTSARRLVDTLGSQRLGVDTAWLPRALDELDQRIIGAMQPPRRLSEIAAQSRAPRYRLLSFLHFLYRVGVMGPWPAIVLESVGAGADLDAGAARDMDMNMDMDIDKDVQDVASARARANATGSHADADADARSDAQRTLGVSAGVDATALKRVYRARVRALHPDLHPDADASDRRRLERALARVTLAYRLLAG